MLATGLISFFFVRIFNTCGMITLINSPSNKNTLETCKNPRPTSGWSELTKSCTTSTMNIHMAYFSWIPQNNARLKLCCKFGESKCNPYWHITLTTSHGMNYVLKSLAPGRSESDSKNVIFNLVLLIGIFRYYDNVLWWMLQDLTYDKSTLVQVMAWCHQATSHYLSQCWPRSMSPNGALRPICNIICDNIVIQLSWKFQESNRNPDWFIALMNSFDTNYTLNNNKNLGQYHQNAIPFQIMACYSYLSSLMNQNEIPIELTC